MDKEKFVIFQWPNKYLWAMIITWPIMAFTKGTVLALARTGFLIAAIIWSYEEIVHGANWFRKLLGFVVLGIIAFDIFRLILPL